MDLKEIRLRIHNEILEARSIERILNSSDFELAFVGAGLSYTSLTTSAIESRNKKQLKELVWARLAKLTPFHEMNTRQLKKIASHNCIENYGSMNKVDLIMEIENVIKRLKKSRK